MTNAEAGAMALVISGALAVSRARGGVWLAVRHPLAVGSVSSENAEFSRVFPMPARRGLVPIR
jgi:hypothetical protein